MGSAGDDRGEFERRRAERLGDETRALHAEAAQTVRRAGELILTAQRIAAQAYVVRLTGELDAASRPAAEEEIAALRTAGTDVALDLSELAFIDSSGLRMLLDLTASPDGAGPVRLLAASPAVVRVAELTGTASRLGIRE